MNDLEILRFERIEEVPAQVWADLSHSRSLFTSRGWSLTLRSSNDRVPVEFWAVRDAGGCLLGIPVHIYPEAPARYTYDVWSLHRRDLVPAAGSDHRSRPHVLIGTRNGQHNGFVSSGRPCDGAAGKLLTAIADAHRSSVVGMLYLDRELMRALTAELPDWDGYFVDAAGELAVPAAGSGIGSFLSTVADSRARGRIRAELRGVEDDPVDRIEDAAAIERLAPVLAPLLANLHRRHGQPADEASMASYIRATAHSGLQPQLFLTGGTTRPKAFSLAVQDENLMSVRVTGFDYESLGERPKEYPRLLMYEPLLYAMRSGVGVIDLGTGALFAKLLRGARAVPLYSLVRLPDGLPVERVPGGDRARLADISATIPKLSAESISHWAVDHD
ncbi:hypothetical protein [Streptomyces sp. NPDC090445]|uniref:hypothetical protein n=1 Tax=Streptomyces sp. NPDC090445 TaxID=3365963 RepID=UPI0038155B8B